MVSRQTRCHTSTETVPQAPQRTGAFKLQQENHLDWSAQSSDIPQSPTLNWNTCTCSYRQSPDAKPELVQSHRLKGVCPAHRNPQRSLCTNSRTCTQNTLSLAFAPALFPVLRHDLPQFLRLSILARSIPATIYNKCVSATWLVFHQIQVMSQMILEKTMIHVSSRCSSTDRLLLRLTIFAESIATLPSESELDTVLAGQRSKC